MGFGYAGKYFGIKGVYDVASKLVLEESSGLEIDTKNTNFDLVWDNDAWKWKIVLSDEVVFDVKEGDEIAQVRVSSEDELAPTTGDMDDTDYRAKTLLGIGSLTTETADRDGTYTLESLEMYLD